MHRRCATLRSRPTLALGDTDKCAREPACCGHARRDTSIVPGWRPRLSKGMAERRGCVGIVKASATFVPREPSPGGTLFSETPRRLAFRVADARESKSYSRLAPQARSASFLSDGWMQTHLRLVYARTCVCNDPACRLHLFIPGTSLQVCYGIPQPERFPHGNRCHVGTL